MSNDIAYLQSKYLHDAAFHAKVEALTANIMNQNIPLQDVIDVTLMAMIRVYECRINNIAHVMNERASKQW